MVGCISFVRLSGEESRGSNDAAPISDILRDLGLVGEESNKLIKLIHEANQSEHKAVVGSRLEVLSEQNALNSITKHVFPGLRGICLQSVSHKVYLCGSLD